MKDMDGGKQTAVFLDRIEDGTAVLVFDDDDARELPVHALPAGAREGDWLVLTLTVDPALTRARRDEALALRRRLGQDDDGGDLSL
jgi:hypothetical protein